MIRHKESYIRLVLGALLALVLAGCSTAPEAGPAAQAAAPTATIAAFTPTVVIPTVTPAPLATPSAVPASPTTAAVVPTPGAAVGSAAFSGEQALANVRWLEETFGSRPAGSPSEQRAAQGLVDRLADLGYNATLQPFPIEHFDDRGSRLRINEEPDRPLPVQTLTNSAAGDVQGPLVDVGLGRPADLAGKDLAGAIALITRGEITFGEKASNVAAAGAVGAVIANRESGQFQGMIADAAPIPVVALSGEDGEAVRQLLATRPLTAALTVDASREQTNSHNVVATRTGTSDDVIVLGAHYDSVAEGPGANDNGSGTATVLELARVLAAAETPYSVHIVLFGSEEIGLVGSGHFVDSLDMAQRERIVAMLNFDMVGVGDQPLVGGDQELIDQALAVGKEIGVPVQRMNDDGRSDHASFLRAGIPALFFYRSDDPRYHSADDRAVYVEAEHLQAAGNLALELLRTIGTAVPAT